MKKLIGIIALSACSLMGQALVFQQNEKVSFADVVANSCLGEDVAFGGTLHLASHETFSGSDNFTLIQHIQPQGVTGVGLTSGAKFNLTGIDRQTTQVAGPLPFVLSYVNRYHIVGTGQAPSFMVQQTFHVTVNANGEITSKPGKLEAVCK